MVAGEVKRCATFRENRPLAKRSHEFIGGLHQDLENENCPVAPQRPTLARSRHSDQFGDRVIGLGTGAYVARGLRFSVRVVRGISPRATSTNLPTIGRSTSESSKTARTGGPTGARRRFPVHHHRGNALFWILGPLGTASHEDSLARDHRSGSDYLSRRAHRETLEEIALLPNSLMTILNVPGGNGAAGGI